MNQKTGASNRSIWKQEIIKKQKVNFKTQISMSKKYVEK